MTLVLGKARSHRAPNLSCRELSESPGWFDVSPKNSARDTIHERARCRDEAANHQLPMAAAFWIICTVSSEDCSSLMQSLMQTRLRLSCVCRARNWRCWLGFRCTAQFYSKMAKPNAAFYCSKYSLKFISPLMVQHWGKDQWFIDTFPGLELRALGPYF